jgi:hypothetical protein
MVAATLGAACSVGMSTGVAAGLGGCGDDPSLRLRLTYEFKPAEQVGDRPQGCYGQPCSLPGMCNMGCAGEVGVWIVDPGLPKTDNADVLDFACLPFTDDPARTLEALPTVLRDLRFERIAEGREVEVELAVYMPRVGQPSCPRFVPGAPTTLPEPAYFGRSGRTRVRPAMTEVTLPVSCWALYTAQCESTATVSWRVRVLDMNFIVAPPAMPETLDLHLMEVAPQMGLATALLGPGLTREAGVTPPRWTARVVFDADGYCPATLATRLGQASFPILSCEGAVSPPSGPGGQFVDAVAYTIDRATVSSMLKALGQSDVPEKGVLIGRVIDGVNPVAAAKVEPVQGDAKVVYLDDNLNGTFSIGGTSTSSEGWFAIIEPPKFPPSDAPCCDYLSAESPVGNGSSCGRVGLVSDLVMGTIIDLSGQQCKAAP